MCVKFHFNSILTSLISTRYQKLKMHLHQMGSNMRIICFDTFIQIFAVKITIKVKNRNFTSPIWIISNRLGVKVVFRVFWNFLYLGYFLPQLKDKRFFVSLTSATLWCTLKKPLICVLDEENRRCRFRDIAKKPFCVKPQRHKKGQFTEPSSSSYV